MLGRPSGGVTRGALPPGALQAAQDVKGSRASVDKTNFPNQEYVTAA